MNRAFGSTRTGESGFTSFGNAAALGNAIAGYWNNYEAVTVGFISDAKKAASNSSPLILGHMYTVAGLIRSASGAITGIKLRNPWGRDGGKVTSGDPNDGIIEVTLQQLWDIRSLGRVNWGRV